MSITILRSDWHWAVPRRSLPAYGTTPIPPPPGRVITGMLPGPEPEPPSRPETTEPPERPGSEG